MDVYAGFALWAIVMLAVVAVARSQGGARIGVLVAAALLPLPLLLQGGLALRVLLTYLIIVGIASSADFAAGRNPRTLVARVAYVLGFVALADAYGAAAAPRRFEARFAARGLVALAIFMIAVFCWIAARNLPGSARFLAWHLSSCAMILAAAEVQACLVHVATAACGVTLPPVHDAPHAARSVAEFWSSRWNPMTGRWLRQHFFSPLVRRSPSLALFVTFVASAAMHVYLILVPGDPHAWLAWAAFFTVQPVVILAERRLRVRRWPRVAGHAWTMGWLFLLSPLFFAPIFEVIGAPR